MKIFGTRTVKIGDEEYPAELTLWALANAEEIRGKPVEEILKLETLHDRVALFYSCLKDSGLELTYDEFWKLIKDKPEAVGNFVITFFTEEVVKKK
jgi:hypothetical protein